MGLSCATFAQEVVCSDLPGLFEMLLQGEVEFLFTPGKNFKSKVQKNKNAQTNDLFVPGTESGTPGICNKLHGLRGKI